MQGLLISAAIILTLVSAAQSVDISCSDPPDIQFASVSYEGDGDYALGTTITYQCQFGYTLKGGGKTLQCVLSDDGDVAEWTKPRFSCSPQSCGDPGYIRNGHRIGTLFTFPNSVKYECDIGYKLIGLPVRYCQTFGEWSGSLPRCEVVSCRPPRDIANGRVAYSSLEFGSEITYHCDKGFLLNTDEAVFCTSNGRWSNADVACVETECDLPLQPEHGSMQIGSSVSKIRAGSIAIFFCDDGRILDGPSTSKCLENGQWTFPAPKCLEPCSIPYVAEGQIGRYERVNYRSRTVVFKQVQIGTIIEDRKELQLRCSEGYEVVNSLKREEKVFCEQGKWSRDLKCTPASCHQSPPYADNAELVIQNEHGGIVTYHCLMDFRKIENETVFCDFGVWKGKPAVCKDTRCLVSVLEFPGLIKGRKSSYRDGEIFRIECDVRYQMANTGTLKCEGGNWKGPLPPCVAAGCKDPPPEIDLAKATVSSTSHGSLVKYVCEEPFIVVGSSPVQCLFGEWKGQLPRCEDSRCYLENLERSFHVSKDSSFVTNSGDKLNVICVDGYSPRTETPVCLNGKWTRNTVSPCRENYCSVPYINHGEVVEERLGDSYFSWKNFQYQRDVFHEKVPIGKIVSPATSYFLKCYNGYSFHGSSIAIRGISCTKGKWFPDPVCLRVGTSYVPTTSVPRPTLTQRTPAMTSKTSSVPVKTTPMTTTAEQTIEVGMDLKQEEPRTTESQPVTEKCSCEYPIDDGNLVASINGKRLMFGESVKEGSVVFFRCEYVGFHLFNGPRENKCENCVWTSMSFPTCTEPGPGNTVILFDNNLNISDSGSLEVNRGQRVRMSCVAIENAQYPSWDFPASERVQVIHERKERETYGDILYVSHLSIETSDFENEGEYECAVEDNPFTTVHLNVNDPNIHCPAFQEEDGISVKYEKGRTVKSKATFSCSDERKELIGNSVLTCLKNGEWSDPAPYCQNIKCVELKGTDLLQIQYRDDREVGSLAIFHCLQPGKRAGASFATCLENGTWSGPTPTCRTPPCFLEDLFSSLPPNVVPDMGDSSNNTILYNTTVRMTCSENFIVVGNPVAKCRMNGTWEIQSIQCVSGCPSISKPPESKLIIKPEKSVYKFGEMITYSCPPGMDLSTEAELIMCLKTGWSETVFPACREREDYTDTEVGTQSTTQRNFT